MKKYLVVYWNNGNKLHITIEAASAEQAKISLYIFHNADDIISIAEVR